jgi:hypothetical protein
MRIEARLWIENIVAILSFLTNFKVDMTDFVNLHKVIVRRNAFSTFWSGQNEDESKGEQKVKSWNVNFQKVKGDLNLQKMPKLVPILKKRIKEDDNCGILCLHSSIVCNKNWKNRKTKRPKINLILSHANRTFLILDPQIEPQAFRRTHCTLKNCVFLNVKKGSIQGSICFKLVPGLLVPGRLCKVAIKV